MTAGAVLSITAVKAQKKINTDSLFKEAVKTEAWEPVPAKVTPGKTILKRHRMQLFFFRDKT